MLTAVLLSLALGPPMGPVLKPPLDQFVEKLDDIDYSGNAAGIEIVARSSDGMVIGVVVMSYEFDGSIRLTSDYDDGYVDVTVRDRDVVDVVSTLPLAVVEMRADAIAKELRFPEAGPLEGWGMCVAKTLVAVGACNSVTWPLTCGPGAFVAACECIPLIVPKDWPRDEC